MRVKREKLGDYLFDYLLQMIGKTRMEVLDDDRWKFNFTMTREQYMKYHKYAVSLIMETLRCTKPKALRAFEWYWTVFGVRIRG